jgi:hypothetical protein
MGATGEARTAVGVAMTSLNWRTRDHRPAESALPGLVTVTVTGAAIEAEMAIAAAALSQFGRQVQVLHLGLEADSDQLGRSTLNLAVVVAAQGSVDWPSAGHIDHLGYIGCQQAPF